METRRIVILGGGYAGIHAAQTLEKKYRKNANVSITLIDRNPYHTLMTELHEIAGSRTEIEAVQISFKRIFASSKVNVVIDEIQNIDFANNVMTSDTASYPYDYLVLGTGGSPEFFGTPGVQENSFTLWSLEDAIRIREHVEIRFRDAAKEPAEGKRRALLRFAVAGAGFTGIELAGELMDRANVLCRKYHIDRDEVDIVVIEAKDTILPILEPKPREAAMRYLKKKKVEVLINAPIVKAEPGKVFLADGRVIETATFIWTCGIQASAFTAKIALTKGKTSNDTCSVASPEGIHGMAGCHFDDDDRYIVGERGRILVNDKMQSVDYSNVFLAGDMIWYLHESKVVPQVVETALQSGEHAAKSIIAAVEGKSGTSFAPKYHGFLVSIGAKYAVAHVMGVNLYGFIAMFTKHLVNIHYLWGVAGFNACWAYVQEEFLHIKDRRSLVGGHAAAKVPAYWVLPLRLFMGFTWFVEGIAKISEGWFKFDKVRVPGLEYLNKTQTDAVTNEPAASSAPAADATAAASEATDGSYSDSASASAPPADTTYADNAAAATPDATAAATETSGGDTTTSTSTPDVPGNDNIFTWALTVFHNIGDWFVPKKALGVYDWFAQHILAAAPYVFQTMLVTMEIGIGLALIAGLFTWIAAVVSIGLALMFLMSAYANPTIYWYIFGAIVLMGGAGHVAGLDYWAMPWLKDRWNTSRLAQRTKLYAGEPRFSRRKSRKD